VSSSVVVPRGVWGLGLQPWAFGSALIGGMDFRLKGNSRYRKAPGFVPPHESDGAPRPVDRLVDKVFQDRET